MTKGEVAYLRKMLADDPSNSKRGLRNFSKETKRAREMALSVTYLLCVLKSCALQPRPVISALGRQRQESAQLPWPAPDVTRLPQG